MSARRAVFLDRDGIINHLVPDSRTESAESPYRAEDVVLMPGAEDAIDRLAEGGYALVVVSNQPAAAKGIASEEDLNGVHDRVVELLGDSASSIDQWRYCRHHPDSPQAELRQCLCRKPKPGMLVDAARELDIDLSQSIMIGDADTDMAAGAAAGCRTILVANPDSEHRRLGGAQPDLEVQDLPEAVSTLLRWPDA